MAFLSLLIVYLNLCMEIIEIGRKFVEFAELELKERC